MNFSLENETFSQEKQSCPGLFQALGQRGVWETKKGVLFSPPDPARRPPAYSIAPTDQELGTN